jgi:lysophospholipase L1-like esterase
MSDLLFFLDGLVLRYEPDEVFIYEGDNDLASGKKPGEILKEAKKVVAAIQNARPGAEVFFISPKPSLARWALRTDYQKLNKRLKRYADKGDKINFIDVWPLMLDEAHEPIKGIFLEDGLHMNKSGYDLWAGEIEKFLK